MKILKYLVFLKEKQRHNKLCNYSAKVETDRLELRENNLE